jgi:raffinose/stachyose/melibiose transport system substrate-binding protein
MQIASSKRDGRRRFGVLAGILMLALALVAGACSSSDDSSSADPDAPVTLRVAMGSPGEAQIAVWEATAASFEESNPNVTVEFNFQDDDLYETIGLPNLLNGGDAPDVYFEWAGQRLQNRYDEGFVTDITDAVQNGELGTYFEEGAYNGMVIDGKNVMVPANADVTTVMWYNVDIFNDLGIAVPTTWDEMITASETIQTADIIPIATGNKDLWPVGNWTSHILSRAMGEEVYDQMLKQEIPMDSPEVVEAMEYVVELQVAGIVNESANAIDDNEGAELFFQGRAAMHPIGSWLVSWAIESAPDLNFDYFNLPPMDGAGVQDSVIAVATGFIVNEESRNKDVAIDFLTLFSSPEFTSQMVDAGGTPLATGALDRDDIDSRILSLTELMQTAGALVAPPDTGYDIEVADALYAAEAEVLGGVSTPAEALATAQAKIGG